MNLTTFSDFLHAARCQPQPQRLLLVFARAELPGDADDAQRAGFARGEGGALVPAVCVDKRPEDIADFAALSAEAAETGADWDLLLIAAMDGRGGHAPSSDEAVQPLKLMVQAIKNGRVSDFLAVRRDGELVQLQRC